MANFDATSYLVVKISDLIDEKYIGCKCIPACWAENPLSNNYLIIRYPEVENSDTRLLVKNKEPPKPAWPLFSALVLHRTDSFEEALEFIVENDTAILTTSDELSDYSMKKTAVPSTSSTSLKRRTSVGGTTIEDNLPKKKRESAIRAENNLKRLIQNGQVDTNKQKVSPKKVLSLQKEIRTATLATLIGAEKFDKLDKLYSKTFAPDSHRPTENVETSDSETETLPLPDRNKIELATPNSPKPTSTTNVPNSTKTTNASITISLPNQTNTPYVPNLINSSQKDTPVLHSVNNPKISKSPLSVSNDTYTTEMSSTNNLGENKELEIDCNENRSSLITDVLALNNVIRGLAPDTSGNKTQYRSTVDIDHIKEIYKTVLELKSKLTAVYKKESAKLGNKFESIGLFVPKLLRGLTLPSLQELNNKIEQTGEEPILLAPRHELPTQKIHTSTPLPSAEPEESSSQSTEPSTSSKCSYIAEWTLKHKGPGPSLTELLPKSNIYVDGAEFVRSKLLAKDMKHLARLIFPLIFSKEAINTCSYSCYGPFGRRRKSLDFRPALDEHARNVLEAFVKQHAMESGWPVISLKLINETLSLKLRTHRNYIKLSKR